MGVGVTRSRERTRGGWSRSRTTSAMYTRRRKVICRDKKMGRVVWDDRRAARRDGKTGLACKFFLLVVRHFRGALLICFVARKRVDGHKVLLKLCSKTWGRSARGKTTAGEEVNQRNIAGRDARNDHAGRP